MTSPASALRSRFWRLTTVYAGGGLVFVVLLVRLFTLQILQHLSWQAQAEENRMRMVSVAPARGIIYDRNGIVLARNIASFNVVITPAYLPADVADIEQIYRDLSELINVPVNQGTIEDAKLIAPCTQGPGIAQLVALGESLAPYEPVKLLCNADEKVAMVVREKAVAWPGVSVEIEPVRDYPTGSLTANIIGFLGPIPARYEEEYRNRGFLPNRDKVGYAGVEASLDDLLMGKPGERLVEVDVAGMEIRNIEAPISPVPGRNVTLTIDARLQEAAQDILFSEIDAWNAYYGKIRISSGVIIAMNPRTGEILAMVQYPTYENNRLARLIPAYYYDQISEDPRHPMLNLAVSAEFPPGSTFKLSTATGALNEGVVSLTQTIEAPGELLLCEQYTPNEPCTESNMRPFVDWIFDENPGGFGTIDFLRCIAYSSNVCFYKLGGGFEDEIPTGLGIWRLQQYARAIGYDQRSGIELQGEAAGLIPDPTWKRIYQGENWSTGDTYIASVGQGYVLATPLQVLLSATTIADDGKAVQPTLVRSIMDGNGNVVPVWRDADLNFFDSPAPDTWPLSPFETHVRWDITVDPVIKDFSCQGAYCTETGLMKTVQPWVVQNIQTGMRMAATEYRGTLNQTYSFKNYPIAIAGKTGTAEYCDDVALAAGRCKFGEWPTHAWTVAFAPYEDPEIAIIAFAYNGGEGGSVAAPIVKMVMDAYFEIKAIDAAQGIIGP